MGDPAGLVADACCAETGHGHPVAHDLQWGRSAQWAWRLAWVSMAAMLIQANRQAHRARCCHCVSRATGWQDPVSAQQASATRPAGSPIERDSVIRRC